MTQCTSFIASSAFHGARLPAARAQCAQRTSAPLTHRNIRRLRPLATAEDVKKPSADTAVDAAPPVAPPQPNEEYQVPGKITLSAEELAEQKKLLDEYTLELRKQQMEIDRENARLFGWVPYAETMNGRFAMFFLAVGFLTEYWTGFTFPQQVELMMRTLGIL